MTFTFMVIQNSTVRFRELAVNSWAVTLLQVCKLYINKSDVEVMKFKLSKILKDTAGLAVVTLVFNHRIPS